MSVTPPTVEPVDIRRLFEDKYVVSDRIPRDRAREGYLVLRSKVEKALLGKLTGRDLDHWENPEVRMLDRLLALPMSLDNHLRVPDGLTSFPCPVYPGRGCSAKNPGQPWPTKPTAEGRWAVPLHVDPTGGLSPPPSLVSDGHSSKTTEWNQWRYGYPFGERDGTLVRNSRSLAGELYKLWATGLRGPGYYDQPKCEFQCIANLDHRASSIRQPVVVPPVIPHLVHLYCLFARYEDEEEAVNVLADQFGIGDGLFDMGGWHDRRSNWRQHLRMSRVEGEAVADIRQAGGRFVHVVNGRQNITEIIQLDSQSQTIVPITAWTRPRSGFRHYLNLPPCRPQLTNQGTMEECPALPVILTDSVEIAMANGNSEKWTDEASNPIAIWSSWYGDGEAVEHIDWSPLERRTVYYVIAPDPNLPVEEAREFAYQTAHAVALRLSTLRKTPRVVFVDLSLVYEHGNEEDPAIDNAAIWSFDQFMEWHSRYELLREESEVIQGFEPLSMKEICSKADEAGSFLLEPVLAERSTTLMYAKTNLGKTWLALCMGAAIAHGTSLFGKWRARRPRKVLYIDSEIDIFALHHRVRIVKRMFFDDRPLPPRHAGNFLTQSRSRSDPDIEQFKRKVVRYVKAKRVALVVLDNLTAFTQHNDSAKAWEETHVWIDLLKQAGCAVIIVHHENKAGGQRGTSATTNAVDNVLHLVDPNDKKEKKKKKKKKGEEEEEFEPLVRDGLLMKVAVEKGREIFGEARKAFIVNIVPNSFPPTCAAEELPEDDKDYEPESKLPRPAAKGVAKRPYRRKSSEREALVRKILDELAMGRGVTETARKLRISPSWIYNCAELSHRAEFRRAMGNRKAERELRGERIFRNYRKGWRVREIVDDEGVSETTVRRAIDDGWIAEMQAQRGFSVCWSEEQVAGLVEGLDEETAARLLRRLRLRRVPRLLKRLESIDQVADSLSLETEDVERVFEKEQNRKQQQAEENRKRENRINQIRVLHAANKPLEQIKAQVDLPKHTVAEIFNGLQREAEDEKAKDSEATDNPDGKA